MLAEQGPIGDTVTLSAANEIVGGEAGVFVPGDGVGMITDTIAILQKARAEFGVFRHAELGIEVSSGENGIAANAQVTGDEVSLIVECVGLERFLREEKFRNI